MLTNGNINWTGGAGRRRHRRGHRPDRHRHALPATTGRAAAAASPTSSRSTAPAGTGGARPDHRPDRQRHRPRARPPVAVPGRVRTSPSTRSTRPSADSSIDRARRPARSSSARHRPDLRTGNGLTWRSSATRRPSTAPTPRPWPSAPPTRRPGGTGNLNNFLYAGTVGGRIFVTSPAAATPRGNEWTNISGRPATARPSRRSSPTRPAAATRPTPSPARGVYHMRRLARAAGRPAWVNITGNLFQVMHDPLRRPGAGRGPGPRYLTSIVADWRYVIPDDADPAQPTRRDPPVLYVGGEGGVYRSTRRRPDLGAVPQRPTSSTPPRRRRRRPAQRRTSPTSTWRWATSTRPPAGPTSRPGPNVLLATTFGRGSFAIRLAPIVFPNTPAQPSILALAPADQVPGQRPDHRQPGPDRRRPRASRAPSATW